jgi:hypothetical protein
VVVQPGPGKYREIDIPPVVLVHKFYYTGDRSFQAQMLPGGPSVIAVNHPKTGQRVYIPVQMLPGAPRVTYTCRAIDYDYGDHGIRVSFGCCCDQQPVVEYRNGVCWSKQMATAAAGVQEKCKGLLDATGLPACGKKVADCTKDTCETAVIRISDVGKAVVTPIIQVAKLLPGVNWLQSSPEERATRIRDAQVTGAAAAAARKDVTINTNH